MRSTVPGHIGCLLIPRFALSCELAERPELRGLPVALGGGDAGPRVVDVSPEAFRYGIDPGVSLREAIGLCPALVVVEPRPAAYERAFEAIVRALQGASPVVERERIGVAYADLTGLERLYGEGLAEALLRCAPADMEPRAGIAPGKFPALAAAGAAEPGRAVVVDAAAVGDFLASRPIDLLPFDPATLRRLRLLGITTLGALTALPRQAVQARLGATGALAWELARGHDDRPVLPEPCVERAQETIEFAPPLTSRGAIITALEPMLARALRQPAVGHRFVRGLALAAATERGRTWRRTLTLKEPSGDRDRLWRAARTLIEYAEFPGSVAELRLELVGLTREGGRQARLFAERTRREELEETLRQLKARYGHCPVGRVVEVEPWSRVPERRTALVDFDP